MNVLWDISLSFIIGTMLILSVVQSNAELSDMYYLHIMHLSTQERAVIVKEILDQDIKRIGLGVTDSTAHLVVIDSATFRFNGDIDMDGIVENVIWYSASDTASDLTENPADIALFRTIDSGTPEKYNIGLLNLRFSYFNDNGSQVSVSDSVKQVGYRFYLESTEGYMGNFSGTYMEGRIRPMNLK